MQNHYLTGSCPAEILCGSSKDGLGLPFLYGGASPPSLPATPTRADDDVEDDATWQLNGLFQGEILKVLQRNFWYLISRAQQHGMCTMGQYNGACCDAAACGIRISLEVEVNACMEGQISYIIPRLTICQGQSQG